MPKVNLSKLLLCPFMASTLISCEYKSTDPVNFENVGYRLNNIIFTNKKLLEALESNSTLAQRNIVLLESLFSYRQLNDLLSNNSVKDIKSELVSQISVDAQIVKTKTLSISSANLNHSIRTIELALLENNNNKLSENTDKCSSFSGNIWREQANVYISSYLGLGKFGNADFYDNDMVKSILGDVSELDKSPPSVIEYSSDSNHDLEKLKKATETYYSELPNGIHIFSYDKYPSEVDFSIDYFRFNDVAMHRNLLHDAYFMNAFDEIDSFQSFRKIEGERRFEGKEFDRLVLYQKNVNGGVITQKHSIEKVFCFVFTGSNKREIAHQINECIQRGMGFFNPHNGGFADILIDTEKFSYLHDFYFDDHLNFARKLNQSTEFIDCLKSVYLQGNDDG